MGDRFLEACRKDLQGESDGTVHSGWRCPHLISASPQRLRLPRAEVIEIESYAGSRRATRRPGYEDYRIFPAKYPNQCSLCSKWLAVGIDVVGKRLSGGQWDILCVACGTAAATPSRAAGSAVQPWLPPSQQVPIRNRRVATGRRPNLRRHGRHWSNTCVRAC